MEEEYKELLKRLIACTPVSSNIEAVNKASACMAEFLRSHGLYVTVECIQGRNTVYASAVKGSKVTDYLLNAHLDVVPLTTPDQAVPVEKDGLLYGRGAADCLGHAATIAQILCENRDCSVAAIFSMDEEIGGETILEMLKRGYTANKGVIILDAWEENSIYYAQKGYLSLKVTVYGRGGHTAYPWNADNALDKLMKGYNNLVTAWVNPASEDNWENTLCVTRIETDSTAANVIPGKATLYLNIRYTDPKEKRALEERVRQLTGADEVETLDYFPPVKVDENSPLVQKTKAIASEENRQPCQMVRMHGATDARHVVTVYPELPVLMDGCRQGNFHAAGEWMDLVDQERVVRIYSRVIRE